MKFSARNSFKGTITDINQGPVSTEVNSFAGQSR